MKNARLAAAKTPVGLVLLLCLLQGGCVTSPTGATAGGPASRAEVWMEEMFGSGREKLTYAEAAELRGYLKDVKMGTPDGCASPLIKYRVQIALGESSGVYYFNYDGTLLGANVADNRAANLSKLIIQVASRLPNAPN